MKMLESAYTHEEPQRLSRGGKTRIRFVLFFLIICPFLNVFGQLDSVSPALEVFHFSSYANYFSVLFATYVLLGEKSIKISSRLAILVGILLLLLFFNYVATPHASGKWLLNWLGFIYFAMVFAQTVKTFSQPEISALQAASLKWLRILIKYFVLAVAITWVVNLQEFVIRLTDNRYDGVVDILRSGLGVTKQPLGVFYGLATMMVVVFWGILKKTDRILFVFSLVIFFPAMLGIRTLLLGLFLCLAWVIFTKNEINKVAMYFSLGILILFGVLNQQELLQIIENSYDRLPSLQFAWSVMSGNLFGLGNGGYHLYVEIHNDTIVALVGSEDMIKSNLFWLAPESDLVYFIASWGILSVIFFAYFIFALLKGGKILHKNYGIFYIDRVMLLMMALMIFMGISQDNAGGLIWWIYMAAGSGVILRHWRNNHPISSRQRQVLIE